MRGGIFKRAAAVVVAVCVSVTFIPLAGDFAFAGENDGTDNPAIEEQNPGAVSEEELEDPQQDSQLDPSTPNEETVVNAADGPDDPSAKEPAEPGKPELVLEEGVYYCYLDGEKQSDFQTIDGALYYFDPVSYAMKTGVVTIDGVLYYFYNSGKAETRANVWFKGDDSSSADRYALGGGKIQTGSKAFTTKQSYKAKVKKKYKKKGKWKKKYVTVTKWRDVTTVYWFNPTDGKKNHGAGFFDDNGKSYYCKGNGILATGWQALKRDGQLNGYFFNRSNGVMAKGTTVGYLRIPANGKLHEAYALGIQKLNKTGWSLKQAYKNSYKIKYQGRWFRTKSSELYAMKGFKQNKGNCYVMAATFYIQAKLLGYNVRQIRGKVAHRAPHSWTQIKHGSKWKVYDPNFKNETRRNGWNIYYGKKGTWRYTNYSVFQN